jgi:hypothetical protein
VPLESATYISELVATNPIVTDEISQGDDHIRLTKSVLQTQFPNLGPAAVTGTAAQLNQAAASNATAGILEIAANGSAGGQLILDGPSGAGKVVFANTATTGNGGSLAIKVYDHTNTTPTTALSIDSSGDVTVAGFLTAAIIKQAGLALLPAGCIIKWHGSVASIPGGWHLCDGTSGTADLRDKFAVGAGGSYAPAQTGGAASVTPTTAAAGTHAHTGLTVTAGGHTHSGVTDSQGAHSHGGNTQSHTLSIGEMPAHDHGLGGNFVVSDASLGGSASTGQAVGSGPFPASEIQFQSQGSSQGHTHGIASDGTHQHNLVVNAVADHQHALVSDGNHTHTVTVATLPPFYAICFIEKL